MDTHINPSSSTAIVYSAESPAYPDYMFGLIPAKKDYLTLSGSVIIIGAAYLPVNITSTDKNGLIPAHLIRDISPIGQEFAECVVKALVKTDERVIIQRSGQSKLDSDLLASIRHAGFDIIGNDKNMVCVGNRSELAQVRWLQDVYDYDDAVLISSGLPMSKLENELVETAYRGEDLKKVMYEFYNKVFWKPQIVESELHGYSLIAGLAGLHGEYLVINRRDADISGLDNLMLHIASNIDIALYRADDIKRSSAVGDPFAMDPLNYDLIPPMTRIFTPKKDWQQA